MIVTACIIENTKVVNKIIVDDTKLSYFNAVTCDETVSIGDSFIDGKFIVPEPAQPQPVSISDEDIEDLLKEIESRYR